MTNLLATLAKSDPTMEADGVSVVYSPDGETKFQCTLARAGGSNNAYHKALEEATRPFRGSGVDLARVDFTKQRALMAGVYAKTIIRGWDEKVFGVPFTSENAEAMFLEVPDFLDFCVQEANKAASYRRANLQAVSGN